MDRMYAVAPLALIRIALLMVATLFAGCVSVAPPPGIGAAIAWQDLPGWSEERHAEAWSALITNCQKLATRDARWRALCDDAALFPDPSDDLARAFFETRFRPHALFNGTGARDGLITGYYEPLLNGSTTRSTRFRYPLYGRPDDLVTIDLGELYPELRDKRVRGRLIGRRVVPYPSRADIESRGLAKNAPVLAWVDDAVDLFFLQVQGSGRIRFTDGKILRVGYADQNGHPYQSIGRTLIARGALTVDEVNLYSIRDWLAANPGEAEAVLNSNPSYVFFELRAADAAGPLGTLGLPLSPERSAAVDPAFVPLGSPIWLDTTLVAPAHPCARDTPASCTSPEAAIPYRRLLVAQDTGGAIKGPVRADVFFGFGAEAERRAGHMKQTGQLYVLMPVAR